MTLAQRSNKTVKLFFLLCFTRKLHSTEHSIQSIFCLYPAQASLSHSIFDTIFMKRLECHGTNHKLFFYDTSTKIQQDSKAFFFFCVSQENYTALSTPYNQISCLYPARTSLSHSIFDTIFMKRLEYHEIKYKLFFMTLAQRSNKTVKIFLFCVSQENYTAVSTPYNQIFCLYPAQTSLSHSIFVNCSISAFNKCNTLRSKFLSRCPESACVWR